MQSAAFYLCVMYRRKKRTRVAPKARTKEEKCVTPWCRNRKAINNTGRQLNLCWKCRSKLLLERHPATYVLNALRQKAKKRRVPLTITLAQFEQWCHDTGYLEKRGKDPSSATIDRINHDEGYHIWNIQILSHEENSTNGHTVPGVETDQNEQQPDYPEREHEREPEYQPGDAPECPF